MKKIGKKLIGILLVIIIALIALVILMFNQNNKLNKMSEIKEQLSAEDGFITTEEHLDEMMLLENSSYEKGKVDGYNEAQSLKNSSFFFIKGNAATSYGNKFSYASETITINETGEYYVITSANFSCRISTGSGTAIFTINVNRNGTNILTANTTTQNYSDGEVFGSKKLTLNKGDKITFGLTTSNTGSGSIYCCRPGLCIISID